MNRTKQQPPLPTPLHPTRLKTARTRSTNVSRTFVLLSNASVFFSLPSNRPRHVMFTLLILITCLGCSYLFACYEFKTNIPAYRPLPRKSRHVKFDLKKTCPDWTSLHEDELHIHTARGGLTQHDIDIALAHPALLHRIFHIAIRSGHLHVVQAPTDCTKTQVCWRRALYLLQQMDDILAATALDDIDVLYWPWDQPFHDSPSYPIWQYNRQFRGKTYELALGRSPGVLIPYSYAFSYSQLIALQQQETKTTTTTPTLGYRAGGGLRQKQEQQEEQNSSSNNNNNNNSSSLHHNTEKRIIFRGGMTFPPHTNWKSSSRGKLCILLDQHPDMLEWIDYGIKDNFWQKTYAWQHQTYGCGQRNVPFMSMKEQATKYGLILDIQGDLFLTLFLFLFFVFRKYFILFKILHILDIFLFFFFFLHDGTDSLFFSFFFYNMKVAVDLQIVCPLY